MSERVDLQFCTSIVSAACTAGDRPHTWPKEHVKHQAALERGVTAVRHARLDWQSWQAMPLVESHWPPEQWGNLLLFMDCAQELADLRALPTEELLARLDLWLTVLTHGHTVPAGTALQLRRFFEHLGRLIQKRDLRPGYATTQDPAI